MSSGFIVHGRNEFNFEKLEVYQRAIGLAHEGSSRSKKEFKRFIDIARGSCFECIPLTTLAFQENLLDESEKEYFYKELTSLSKMLSGLKKSMN